MPGTLESALVLVILAGPGFIASRLLNSLVAYRTPTAFQETTQAVVFSAVMVPIWLVAARPLLAARNAMLAVWKEQEQASQLPWWAIWMPILIFSLVYFVAAPSIALLWAFFVRRRPHIRLAQWLLRRFGLSVRYDEGPEVWDGLFAEVDMQRWVRVTFKDGRAIEGLLISAGVSPSMRQLQLGRLPDVEHSLAVLDEQGAAVEDLGARGVESVWIEVASEVRRVDIYES
jgi:hypothetical protein